MIGIGEQMTAANAGKGADGMRAFSHGVSALIEDIHGFANQLSARFGIMDGYDPKAVEEGMAVLKELRRLVLYAGEFGC